MCYARGMLAAPALAAVFASAVLITIADALIKKVALGSGVLAALSDPWMLLICTLYLAQIVLAIYIFEKGELAVYANLFIVFYSVLMVLFGMFFFREQLTALQAVGVVFALIGAVLLNG